LKLGFEISECTVSAAMDFFTVPTVTFRVLYCFFVIAHSRRKILHINATEHPTAPWIVQQVREAFPEDRAPRYLVLIVTASLAERHNVLECLGRELIRTAYRSPWQNGVAERRVGSCRRELLDHVIVLSESHLRRLVQDYIRYYHEDRVHDALNQDTPAGRVLERRQSDAATVVGVPPVGGLHHRYQWQTAA
jgi:putative transposase